MIRRTLAVLAVTLCAGVVLAAPASAATTRDAWTIAQHDDLVAQGYDCVRTKAPAPFANRLHWTCTLA